MRKLATDIAAEGGWSLYHQNEPNAEYVAASAEAFERGKGAINLGQGADIQMVGNELKGKICLTGGIDPLAIARPLDLEELERILLPVIEMVDKSGGFMLNSGGQIAVETPEENIRRIFEIVSRTW